MSRSVDGKKPVKHQTDQIVERRFLINEDVWRMAAGMATATHQTIGEFLEPMIKDAYREWLNQEAKRLHI